MMKFDAFRPLLEHTIRATGSLSATVSNILLNTKVFYIGVGS